MHRQLLAALLGALALTAGATAAHAETGTAIESAPTATLEIGSASPSNTGSLTFTLTFSEPVSGLEAGDLTLGGTATGCALGDPAGGEASWSVTVSGCASGTVSLTLAAHSVVNAAGEAGPPDAVTSPTGTIDLDVPTVATFAATTPSPVTGRRIDYQLVFSEPVGGLAADDFTVTGTSTGWSVTGIAGEGAGYVVTLGTATLTTGTVELRLRRETVTDAAGNIGPPTGVSAPTVNVRAATASASLVINSGATSTSDPALQLALTAKDFGSDLQMRFSVDGGTTWTEWRAFAPTHQLALPAKHSWGTLTVTGDFRDAAGARVQASSSIAYVQAVRSAMALRPRYTLRATLDYANARLTVRQIVDITNQSGHVIGYLDFSVLARYYGELAIGAVSVDGRAAATSYPNVANARVALGYNLRPGESARVILDFTAKATSATGDYLKGAFAKANGLMQMSSWYPLLSDGHGLRHPGDSQFSVAADYRLELTHPRSVRIAAPGKLVSSTATTKVYTLPNAREYVFAASPGFLISAATASNGVRVQVHYLSGTSGVATALRTAVRGIERMSANLGAYPYGRFLVVQGARSGSATEFSGLVFVGRSYMGSTYVVGHEVAHQWWYGVVGNNQMAEPWLDEAFAEFSGRYFFGLSMPSYCSSRVVNSAVTDFPNSPSAYGCDSYSQTIYHKGAAFLNGIRTRMGTGAFLQALRAIVAENRYGVVTTATVRATFRRFAANKAALDKYMNSFLR